MGWGPALIITLGSFVIGLGILAVAAEAYGNYKRKQRRNKRLYKQGNLYWRNR
jgi:hypothetical protein